MSHGIAATRYLLASECKHEPPFRPLFNGEFACDRCMHVAVRADGSSPVYDRLSPHAKAALEASVANEDVTNA
jgi:hypothetical protein